MITKAIQDWFVALVTWAAGLLPPFSLPLTPVQYHDLQTTLIVWDAIAPAHELVYIMTATSYILAAMLTFMGVKILVNWARGAGG